MTAPRIMLMLAALVAGWYLVDLLCTGQTIPIASEAALALVVCAQLARRAPARPIVGRLGMYGAMFVTGASSLLSMKFALDGAAAAEWRRPPLAELIEAHNAARAADNVARIVVEAPDRYGWSAILAITFAVAFGMLWATARGASAPIEGPCGD